MLSRCFFELEHGVDEWARGGDLNVLFLDGTFSTNRAGLTLVAFTTVSSTGQTVVLAIGLLRSQSALCYEWLYRRFHDVFKVKPAAVFTDSAIELELSIVECSTIETDIWHGVQHFLCTYHLSQNLFEHCKKSFGSDTQGWKSFVDLFWKLAKESDASFTSTFTEEFQALIQMVPASTDEDLPVHPAVTWLQDTLLTKKEKWAACHTWACCTWGAHSTQRSESYNRVLKLKANKHTRVTELVTVRVSLTDRLS